MIIKFDRTLEDLIEFNLFHFEHSPHLQRNMLISRIITTVLVVIAALAATYLLLGRTRYFDDVPAYIAAIVASLAGGAILFIRYPSYYRAEIINSLKKSFLEGENEGFLGQQKIEASAQGMVYTNQAGESKINWAVINRVAQNDKYIFLYTSSMNAITIPRSAFSDTKVEQEFLEMVHEHSGA